MVMKPYSIKDNGGMSSAKHILHCKTARSAFLVSLGHQQTYVQCIISVNLYILSMEVQDEYNI